MGLVLCQKPKNPLCDLVIHSKEISEIAEVGMKDSLLLLFNIEKLREKMIWWDYLSKKCMQWSTIYFLNCGKKNLFKRKCLKCVKI